MSLTRYKVFLCERNFEPDGKWVLADEAIAEIAERDERIAELEAACEKLVAWYNRDGSRDVPWPGTLKEACDLAEAALTHKALTHRKEGTGHGEEEGKEEAEVQEEGNDAAETKAPPA